MSHTDDSRSVLSSYMSFESGNKEMLMLNMEDQRQQLESRFEITNNQLTVGNTGGETCHREENITRHHGLDMEGRIHNNKD